MTAGWIFMRKTSSGRYEEVHVWRWEEVEASAETLISIQAESEDTTGIQGLRT